jgi:Glyoxalase-like domain
VLIGLASVVAVSVAISAQRAADDGLAQVDHLVYATPDLDLGVKTIEGLLGVRATAGGQHPGLGTRNALIALGTATYLEIIGPDPDQPKPAGPRRFGIDDLRAPQIVGWVAKGTRLEQVVVNARNAGVGLGTVIAGSRKRPDGMVLSWRYTDPAVVLEHRLIPYLIDWGTSPHPATSAPRGATLVAFRAEHPDAARVEAMLRHIGLNLPVQAGSRPALIATIDCPKGRVELLVSS